MARLETKEELIPFFKRNKFHKGLAKYGYYPDENGDYLREMEDEEPDKEYQNYYNKGVVTQKKEVIQKPQSNEEQNDIVPTINSDKAPPLNVTSPQGTLINTMGIHKVVLQPTIPKPKKKKKEYNYDDKIVTIRLKRKFYREILFSLGGYRISTLIKQLLFQWVSQRFSSNKE